MLRYNEHRLKEWVRTLVQTIGAADSVAVSIAESLVGADLRGVSSHGVLKIPNYISKIDAGHLNPHAIPETIIRHAMAFVDGNRGFGQPAAISGTLQACELAEKFGVATAVLHNVNHVGRLGEYVELAATRGCCAMAVASGAGRGGSVAPFGGTERLFGTNPIAFAIPRPNSEVAIVSDFATSAVAASKLEFLRNKGQTTEGATIIDNSGMMVNDPNAFFSGGAIMPFGGHKGSGLSLFIELFTAALIGFPPSSSSRYQQGNPTIITVWNVDQFGHRKDFDEMVIELIGKIVSSKPLSGHDRVLLPGQLETEALYKNRIEGIPVDSETDAKLKEIAHRFGIAELA